MAGVESAEQKPRPESISATKAEERLSSRDGGNRPSTNQSASSRRSRTLLPSSQGKEASNSRATPRTTATPTTSKFGHVPPDNTPRDLPMTNGNSSFPNTDGNSHTIEGSGSILSSLDQMEENILEEDELFMTLTDEERNEWEAMLAGRSKQLEDTMTNHQNWSENFTKRRMYAHCRMRKLIASYAQRSKFLSDLTHNLNQVSPRKMPQETKAGSGVALETQDSSDSAIVSPRKQKSSKSAALNASGKVFSNAMPSVPEDSSSPALTTSPLVEKKSATSGEPVDRDPLLCL